MSEELLGYIHRFRGPYHENLQITSFARLIDIACRTRKSVKKATLGNRSNAPSADRPPWKNDWKKAKAMGRKLKQL
jgi:hypothetical protein